jgi:hypothetical protein
LPLTYKELLAANLQRRERDVCFYRLREPFEATSVGGTSRCFELCSGDRTYRLIARARHNDSKLSAASGSDARETNGLLGLSVSTVIGVAGEDHCNADFEITVLPSYQHFRPSIRRHDHQCPCGSKGRAILHCFACAVGTTIGKTVMMQAAKIRMVIEHLVIAFSCGLQPVSQIWSQIVETLATFWVKRARQQEPSPGG